MGNCISHLRHSKSSIKPAEKNQTATKTSYNDCEANRLYGPYFPKSVSTIGGTEMATISNLEEQAARNIPSK